MMAIPIRESHPSTERRRSEVVSIMGQGGGRIRNAHHLMGTDEKGRGAIAIRNDHVSRRGIVGDIAAMVEKIMMNEVMVPIETKAVVTLRRRKRAVELIVIIATKAIEIKVIGVMRTRGKAVGTRIIDTIKVVTGTRVIITLSAEKHHILIVTPMAKREVIKAIMTPTQRTEFIEMNAA